MLYMRGVIFIAHQSTLKCPIVKVASETMLTSSSTGQAYRKSVVIGSFQLLSGNTMLRLHVSQELLLLVGCRGFEHVELGSGFITCLLSCLSGRIDLSQLLIQLLWLEHELVLIFYAHLLDLHKTDFQSDLLYIHVVVYNRMTSPYLLRSWRMTDAEKAAVRSLKA